MCHGHTPRDWSSTVRSEQDDEEETPSFLEDEPAEDVEIVTDGGDEEDDT